MRMVCSAYTDMGGRENNEDSYIATKKRGRYLYVVADGLGGHDCGELASRIAVEEIHRQFRLRGKDFSPRQAIEDANRIVIERQRADNARMKTTVALVYIDGERVVCAHVGDSRIYVFKGAQIAYQSTDHSVAQLAMSTGEIGREDVRRHEDRNVLIRAVGATEKVKVDVMELSGNEIDGYLLCSDGFWEYVFEEEMSSLRQVSPRPKKWLKKMRELLNDRIPKKNDNNTAIVAIRKGV